MLSQDIYCTLLQVLSYLYDSNMDAGDIQLILLQPEQEYKQGFKEIVPGVFCARVLFTIAPDLDVSNFL